MKYNNDFRHDLLVGQLGEKALGDLLEGKTIEVKTDLQAQKTGNVFIEFSSRGKYSGIATSEADYWCFKLSDEQFVLLSTEKTKQLVKKNSHRKIRGGDSDTSYGVLVPLIDLLK